METRCWYCGSDDIEADNKGFKCKACSATYVVMLTWGLEPFKGEGYKVTRKMNRDCRTLKIPS